MKIVLKPLKEQVILITGASSGIGLVTARMAAQKGATIVAVARNENALQQLTEEINLAGGTAMYVQADVGNEVDVIRAANAAIASFGRFDTWINNANVIIRGNSLNVSVDDMKRMFDTNFWGAVYGSRAAVNHYKQRRGPGAIINTGSFFGDRTIIEQATYSISKQAVHGWTDALRLELEKDNLPISVSLIHPASTDKQSDERDPQYAMDHATQREDAFDPESVAEAILYCAQHPKRDMFVSFQAKFFSVLEGIAPRLTDKLMEVVLPSPQQSPGASRKEEHSDRSHPENGSYGRGTSNGFAKPKRKSQTPAKRPLFSSIVVAGLGAGLWMLTKKKTKIQPKR